MSKSKSKHTAKCQNCIICDKVTKIQEHNDVNQLLANVELWDTEIPNQYKQIFKFECLLCYFKSTHFNEWKCHIVSKSHLAECHKIKNSYSYVCEHKKCKVLMYGSIESLSEHKAKHSQVFYCSIISILMAKIMKFYVNKHESHMYYCSHCKQFSNKPIHKPSEVIVISKNKLIEYDCKYCRVSFICSPEILDCHSLSLEHMTIKCLDLLFSKAKVNSKKLKLSEESIPIKNNNLPIIQNTLTANSLNLPLILLHRFQNIDHISGKCKLCNHIVFWDCLNILKHLYNCKYKFDLRGVNTTAYVAYMCIICNFSTYDISGHKTHITSIKHLKNCFDTTNLYSYFCKGCKVYMYGHEIDLNNHQKLNHNQKFVKLPKLSVFMAQIFRDINTNPDQLAVQSYFRSNEPVKSSKYTFVSCYVCKIEFSSVIDYEMHEITSEHIILKFLTPRNLKESLKNKLYSTVVSKKKTIDPSVNDSLSFSTKLAHNKHSQSVGVNKCQTIDYSINQTKVDVNCTIQLDDVKKNQKLPVVNINGPEKSDKNLLIDNVQFNGDTPMQNQSKQQYTKHFNHKMKLLKLLEQFKDRILKSLSFYCDICDFMTDEKCNWDVHNEREHPDNKNKFTVFCSTCYMLILCNSIEEHNTTTEHCNLLKFLQLFNSVEKNIIKNQPVVATVESCTINETSIEQNKNEQVKSNSSDLVVETQYLNNSYNIGEEKIIKHIGNDNGSTLTNTVFLLNCNDRHNEQSVSNEVINCGSKITPIPNNSLSISSTVPYEPIVNIKTEETYSLVDVSVSKDSLNKGDSLNELTNGVINSGSKIKLLPNNSLSILPTVPHEPNVIIKTKNTNSLVDVSVFKDSFNKCVSHNELTTDEISNELINCGSKIIPVPNISLSISPTVPHEPIVDIKTEETNSLVDVSVSKDSFNKGDSLNELTNEIINCGSKIIPVPNISLSISPTVPYEPIVDIKTEETNSLVDVSVSKDSFNKGDSLNELTNELINCGSKIIPVPNISLSISPTVPYEPIVDIKTEETNSLVDVSVSKDSFNKGDSLNELTNETINCGSKIIPVPNISLSISPIVPHEPIVDIKMEETNSLIDVSVSKDSFNKGDSLNELTNEIINCGSKIIPVPNISLSISPTVPYEPIVDIKTEETNSLVDVSVSKDSLRTSII